jgi:superfamily II DNA or RNA helicase
VVFSTIQSAAAEQNIGFLDRLLNQSPKGVFVVVDEAHHAPAPSYVRVLRMLKDAGAKLIGLTATPVRMNDEETQSLSNLFDGKVLCRVHMRTLIEQGILSTPAIETINTHVEFEREFDESDFEHLTHFRELSPQILDRLAVHGSRNRLIVKHYGKNAEKYGKTLVFAANTLHALTLAKEFQKAGISADYVDYTRRTEDNSSSRYLLQFLGLRRLTNKGREKMKSVFSAAVRQKIVASDGGKIVLLRKTSADSV